jgi:hypothetical protein
MGRVYHAVFTGEFDSPPSPPRTQKKALTSRFGGQGLLLFGFINRQLLRISIVLNPASGRTGINLNRE